MDGAAIVAHAIGIAHGIGAALACAALFYVSGLALVPRRLDRTLGAGESPAVLGAALYVLAGWFGIELGAPLHRLAIYFAAGALVLAAVRFRRVAATLKTVRPATFRWLSAFVVLYILAYLFTMPPATTGEYLPATWTGNIDLLNYVCYTRYVLKLGPSNLVGFSYLDDIYRQTPGVFYLLGGLSLFFRQGPLSAAMPAAFAATALTGVFAARISRSVFGLSRGAGIAIAGILISGPFFRYIASNYFLSTLMAMPILLYLVWTTVSCRPSRFVDTGVAIRFGSAYVLLLFVYPFLFFVGVGAQAVTVVLMLVAERQAGDEAMSAWREAARNAVRRFGTMAAPLALIGLGLFKRVTWSINEVRSLARIGVAGWPLDLISPLAMLGLPGTGTDRVRCSGCAGIEVTNPGLRIAAIAFLCTIAIGLGLLSLGWLRRMTTPAQRAIAGLAGGAFLLYCGFFLVVGPSYQQWKLASYVALPWSFVVFAAAVGLIQHAKPFTRAIHAPSGRLATALLASAAVVMIGGNLLARSIEEPEPMKLPAALRNIELVDRLQSFRDISVQMDEAPDSFPTYLALYFLPSKRVHVIGSSFSPTEPLSYENVSNQRPLLLQGFGCEGVGHNETFTVPDVGCLLFAPPSLTLDTPYPFNRTFLFVASTGLGAREPEGRWNSESTVTFKLTAALSRIWVGDNAFVNLRLNPYLPPGTTRQRAIVSWGDNQRVEVSLGAREQISLPVGPADWTGNRVWTLPISIELPDGVTPPWMYTPRDRTDLQPLAVLFEELSISRRPLVTSR